MKNGFDEKVKGHGFFRKTKAFGLASGIALGAALLIGANTVSADEATPAPQSPAAPKAQLPHTGTEASLALTLAGLAVAGIATTMVRKKKEQ